MNSQEKGRNTMIIAIPSTSTNLKGGKKLKNLDEILHLEGSLPEPHPKISRLH